MQIHRKNLNAYYQLKKANLKRYFRHSRKGKTVDTVKQ